MAALSIGQVQYAASLIRAVAKKFPDSTRANRLKVSRWGGVGHSAAVRGRAMLQQALRCARGRPPAQGMYWEAQGQLDQAEQIYKDMLEQQPSSEMAAKRLVRGAGHVG